MVRLIIISMAVLMLVNCGGTKNVKIVEKYLPVNSVPTPPETQRPVLYVDRLTTEQKTNKGEVAKAYKVSIKQLQSYSSILEAIISEYRVMAEQSKKDLDLLQRFSQPTVEAVGPFSSANPEEGEVTFTQIVGEPLFNFQHEYDRWKVEQRFKELEGEMNNINSSSYLNIDE